MNKCYLSQVYVKRSPKVTKNELKKLDNNNNNNYDNFGVFTKQTKIFFVNFK